MTQINHQAARYVFFSQIFFICGLLACFVIDPKVILENRVLSTFGIHGRTLIPFALTLLLPALMFFRAAELLNRHQVISRRLYKALVAMAISTIGVLITPFTLGPLFFFAHMVFSFCLFILELVTAIWLARMYRDDLMSVLLAGFVVLGQILTILSLDEVNLLNFSSTGQILALWSFAVLLARSVARMDGNILDHQVNG